MRLRAFVVGGEEETRKVRCGAAVVAVDDSGCNWWLRQRWLLQSEEEVEEAATVAEEGLTATEMEAAASDGW
ncbi:hypothetical protein B296_00024669 [Ensete ventricosum]|uniref:Uncharacterized protein n=1 Tax=Ensete ventricosum TaxID=4639 RepID=A0A426Z244_ENSVE|nr:hypothetical protein B296_00024669 [Ensete ventricosum]